jgi:hypothetical protein
MVAPKGDSGVHFRPKFGQSNGFLFPHKISPLLIFNSGSTFFKLLDAEINTFQNIERLKTRHHNENLVTYIVNVAQILK